MTNYSVLNPVIVGSLHTEFQASSPLDAAHSFFNEMSSNKVFYGPAESFYFTMKDDNNKVFNFHVKESPSSKSNNVNYSIKSIPNNLSAKDNQKLISHFSNEKNKIITLVNKYSGGGILSKTTDSDSESFSKKISLSYLKKDDSSSSSDDDDDDYDLARIIKSRILGYPYSTIKYFGYDPTIYIAKNVTFPNIVPSLDSPYQVLYPFFGLPGIITRIP